MQPYLLRKLARLEQSSQFQLLEIYTTAGEYTFTVPYSGWYDVWVIGGGGGSGGFSLSGASAYNALGGAGAGGGAYKRVCLETGQQIPVTVGAGGTAGTAGGGTATGGSGGGTSSFGNYCSATGGYGGPKGEIITNTYQLIGNGTSGGMGSGGDINVQGGSGLCAVRPINYTNGTAAAVYPGAGGASPFLGSQAPCNNQLTDTYFFRPNPGQLGGGASGFGLYGAYATAVPGAKGGAGVVIINYAGGGNE